MNQGEIIFSRNRAAPKIIKASTIRDVSRDTAKSTKLCTTKLKAIRNNVWVSAVTARPIAYWVLRLRFINVSK
ncbi:hypothetical protein D3C76_1682390 [compost metagenome]